MADLQRAEGMDIPAFFGVLRRRLPLIAAAAVVAAVAAYFISDAQEPEYTAQATLLLEGTPPDSETGTVQFPSPVPETAPDREALVMSGEVLRRVYRQLENRLGRQQAGEVALDAFSGVDSTLLELEGTAPDPEVAALAANTLARTNIAVRRDRAVSNINKAIRAAERRLARLRNAGLFGAARAGAINQAEIQIQEYRSLAETHDGDAQIVTAAEPPSSPSAPKPTRNAVIAGFGGLLLGLALALVGEQLDRRVRQSKDLEEVFGLPVLASVPKSKALGAQNGKALERLPGQEAEAFQMLRANLHYLNTDRELRSVVVTSTGIGDGKSTVALNLAKADALVGQRVLLVEADVRRPRLAIMLGIEGSEGLNVFLSNFATTLADVTHRIPIELPTNGVSAPWTLDLVVAGEVAENPSGLMASDRMRDLIREAEANYDLVVIDTAPTTMVADSIPLMSEASAVVIVGRVGKITNEQASQLREQLERLDAPTFGLVANFAGSASKYGYSYY